MRPLEEVDVSDASLAHRSAACMVRHRRGDLEDLVACPPDPDAEVRVLSVYVEVLIENADFVQEASSNQYVAEVIDFEGFVGDV